MPRKKNELKALDAALKAHRTALASQQNMIEAATRRDDAVRAAIQAGNSTKDIAAHIGVTQRRVQAMANSTPAKPKGDD